MGYYVSPDSSGIRGVSSNIGTANLDLNGSYVNTAVEISTVRASVTTEVLDINSSQENIREVSKGELDFTKKSFSDASAIVVGEVSNVALSFSSDMEESLGPYTQFLYSLSSSKQQKVNVYAWAFLWGLLDNLEALGDSADFFIRLILAGEDKDYILSDLSASDVKDNLDYSTGANVDGAFALGQTVGKIAMCAAIVLLGGTALAAIGVPATVACAVVGFFVGFGLAIDAGVTDILPLLYSSAKEALSFYLIALGITKAAAAVKEVVQNWTGLRGLFRAFLEKINPLNMKERLLSDIDDAGGVLKYFLKRLVKWDSKAIHGADFMKKADAIVTFLSKFVFKVVDIGMAFYSNLFTGANSLKGFLIKTAYGLVGDLTGYGDILGFFESHIINFLSGKGTTGSMTLSDVISNIPKFIAWLFKDVVPENITEVSGVSA